MGDVSSLDLDPALTEDSTGARSSTGGADDAAADSDSEARLRRGLHRATATNARMSAVVLVLATIYVGWLAERFAASRPLAVALVAIRLTAAVWRWSIGRAASIEIIPGRGREPRFYSALDQNAYLVCLLWAPATLLVYPAITDCELLIVVADTGIGIPEEIQDRVFEPFFSAPQTTNRKDGLGLGLAIVKALVIKLGGQVELQSRAGKGTTTVIVAIPLVE